jgi:hypothetical protein
LPSDGRHGHLCSRASTPHPSVVRTHTCRGQHTFFFAGSVTHLLSRKHPCSHAPFHTHTRTHTYSHTHTHTRTHTHTHLPQHARVRSQTSTTPQRVSRTFTTSGRGWRPASPWSVSRSWWRYPTRCTAACCCGPCAARATASRTRPYRTTPSLRTSGCDRSNPGHALCAREAQNACELRIQHAMMMGTDAEVR